MIISLLISFSFAWESVDVNPPLPSPRAGHSLVSYEGELYLFGGCSLDEECYNDLQVYNATDAIWTILSPTGSVPAAREGHSSTLVGNKLYIFGGTTLTELLSDVYILDFESLKWEKAELAGSVTERAYHSAALFDQGLIVIFGGMTSSGLTDQVLVLDTVNKHWGKPPTIGTKPSPRKLTSFDRHDSLIWLFGGDTDTGTSGETFTLDLKKKRWDLVYTIDVPAARHGHGSVVYGDSIYMSAGCDRTKDYCFSDLYVFYPLNRTWFKISEGDIDPRESHGFNIIGQSTYIFGGRFFVQKVYGDFFEYDTENPCPDSCSNNGSCIESNCKCNPGFSGLDCSIETKCKLDCSRHGFCIDFECSCYPGYYGNYCQGYINCPNNCTSGIQGTCQDDGSCECLEGFLGEDCSLKSQLELCEDTCEHGNCESTGKCKCSRGWIGVNCDIEMPITYSSVYDVYEAEKAAAASAEEDEEGDDQVETDESDDTASDEEEDESQTYTINEEVMNFDEESYTDLTESQDLAASQVSSDNSTHIIIPEMFGFADQEDPLNYQEGTLRSDPETDETLDWIADLEEKQKDRIDEIESCTLFCSYHGVCYDSVCYCEEGYTGNFCELKDSDLDKGLALTTATIVLICLFVFGCLFGVWVYYKIMKDVEGELETKALSKNPENRS